MYMCVYNLYIYIHSHNKQENHVLELKDQLATQVSNCQKYCVTIPHLPKKDATSLAPWRQKKLLEQFQSCFRDLATKMKMPTHAVDLATRYYTEVFLDASRGTPENECKSPEGDPSEPFTAAWDEKWTRLFRLQSSADFEAKVSDAALLRVFMAAEIANVTGGGLKVLKKAMDTAISTRVRSTEVKMTEDGEEKTGGIWLEPADVIREMLKAAGARPNSTYKINIMGDGRCFGNARNTTFFALRIVYLDNYSSTSQEALWPLAIFDCKEKRGILRTLTRSLRKALEHVQNQGIHLSEEYTRFFQDQEDIDQDYIRDREKRMAANTQSGLSKSFAACRKDLSATTTNNVPATQETTETYSDSDSDDDPEPTTVEDIVPEAWWDMDDGDCQDTDDEYCCPEADHCLCKRAGRVRVPTCLPVHIPASVPASVLASDPVIDDTPPPPPISLDDRHVNIDLWLSGDMKFLLMVCGLKQANSKHACIYCTADLTARGDWTKGVNRTNDVRHAKDPITKKTGQHFKNLFAFIPRTRCMIDTLHLLLRCVDRLVHTTALLWLDIFRPLVSKDDSKSSHLNCHLAPVVAKAMGKGRVSFSAPAGGSQGSVWTVSGVSGTAYRKLLKNFKFKDIIPSDHDLTKPQADLLERHQKMWDDFRKIFLIINSSNRELTKNTFHVRNSIKLWFKHNIEGQLRDTEEVVSMYLKRCPDPSPKANKDDYLYTIIRNVFAVKKNDPLVVASFLLTPYFHCLLKHVPDLLTTGDLRSFSGQNFERRNNEHRLFWQNSSKRQGEEIPSILNQDLRNCLNPIRRTDLAKKLQCPANLQCAHKGFTYLKSFAKHLKKDHDITFDYNCLTECEAEAVRRTLIAQAGSREFARDVTEEALKQVKKRKSLTNSDDYQKNGKTERKDFHAKLKKQRRAATAAQQDPIHR